MSDTYLPCDYRSLEMHQLIASKIEQNPALLEKARSNIARWKKQNDFPQPYLDDWLVYINGDLSILIAFMISTTDEAQRLRSSNPFTGILTQQERDDIFRRYRFCPRNVSSSIFGTE